MNDSDNGTHIDVGSQNDVRTDVSPACLEPFLWYFYCLGFLFILFHSSHAVYNGWFLYSPLLRSTHLPVSRSTLKADMFRESLRGYFKVSVLTFVIFLLAFVLDCFVFPYDCRTALFVIFGVELACYGRAYIAYADLDYEGYRFIINLPHSVFDGGRINREEVDRIRVEKKRAARARLVRPLKTFLDCARRWFNW